MLEALFTLVGRTWNIGILYPALHDSIHCQSKTTLSSLCCTGTLTYIVVYFSPSSSFPLFVGKALFNMLDTPKVQLNTLCWVLRRLQCKVKQSSESIPSALCVLFLWCFPPPHAFMFALVLLEQELFFSCACLE